MIMQRQPKDCWESVMSKNEDDLNWTHFPQDKDEYTLADLSDDEARQAAKKALAALRRKKREVS